MIKVKELFDIEQIKTIITDPILWNLTYGQGHNLEDFQVDVNNTYLGIYNNNDLCGMFELREFNKITMDVHIYILPKYQQGQISLDAVNKGLDYLRSNTNIKNVITTVPVDCKHVLKLLQRTEFKARGLLIDGIFYNQKRQDLLLFQCEV